MINKINAINYKSLLLCAGNSKRFQGTKLVASISKNNVCKPLVQHAADSISDAFEALNIPYSNIYLTTGKHHKEIVQNIKVNKDINIFYCDNANKGMSHSLIQGINKILKDSAKTTHIMIALADQIALTKDDYVKLIKQSFNSPKKIISSATPAGLSAPVIFPCKYFELIKTLQGDVGAKPIVLANMKNVERVFLENAEFDIDTQTDLNIWNEKQRHNQY